MSLKLLDATLAIPLTLHNAGQMPLNRAVVVVVQKLSDSVRVCEGGIDMVGRWWRVGRNLVWGTPEEAEQPKTDHMKTPAEQQQ